MSSAEANKISRLTNTHVSAFAVAFLSVIHEVNLLLERRDRDRPSATSETA